MGERGSTIIKKGSSYFNPFSALPPSVKRSMTTSRLSECQDAVTDRLAEQLEAALNSVASLINNISSDSSSINVLTSPDAPADSAPVVDRVEVLDITVKKITRERPSFLGEPGPTVIRTGSSYFKPFSALSPSVKRSMTTSQLSECQDAVTDHLAEQLEAALNSVALSINVWTSPDAPPDSTPVGNRVEDLKAAVKKLTMERPAFLGAPGLSVIKNGMLSSKSLIRHSVQHFPSPEPKAQTAPNHKSSVGEGGCRRSSMVELFLHRKDVGSTPTNGISLVMDDKKEVAKKEEVINSLGVEIKACDLYSAAELPGKTVQNQRLLDSANAIILKLPPERVKIKIIAEVNKLGMNSAALILTFQRLYIAEESRLMVRDGYFFKIGISRYCDMLVVDKESLLLSLLKLFRELRCYEGVSLGLGAAIYSWSSKFESVFSVMMAQYCHYSAAELPGKRTQNQRLLDSAKAIILKLPPKRMKIKITVNVNQLRMNSAGLILTFQRLYTAEESRRMVRDGYFSNIGISRYCDMLVVDKESLLLSLLKLFRELRCYEGVSLEAAIYSWSAKFESVFNAMMVQYCHYRKDWMVRRQLKETTGLPEGAIAVVCKAIVLALQRNESNRGQQRVVLGVLNASTVIFEALQSSLIKREVLRRLLQIRTNQRIRVDQQITAEVIAHIGGKFPPSYAAGAGFLIFKARKNDGSKRSLSNLKSHRRCYCRLNDWDWLDTSHSARLALIERSLEFDDYSSGNRKRPLIMSMLTVLIRSCNLRSTVLLKLAATLRLAHDGLLRGGNYGRDYW